MDRKRSESTDDEALPPMTVPKKRRVIESSPEPDEKQDEMDPFDPSAASAYVPKKSTNKNDDGTGKTKATLALAAKKKAAEATEQKKSEQKKSDAEKADGTKKRKKFKVGDESMFGDSSQRGKELKASTYVNNEPCDVGRSGVRFRLVNHKPLSIELVIVEIRFFQIK